MFQKHVSKEVAQQFKSSLSYVDKNALEITNSEAGFLMEDFLAPLQDKTDKSALSNSRKRNAFIMFLE